MEPLGFRLRAALCSLTNKFQNDDMLSDLDTFNSLAARANVAGFLDLDKGGTTH